MANSTLNFGKSSLLGGNQMLISKMNAISKSQKSLNPSDDLSNNAGGTLTNNPNDPNKAGGGLVGQNPPAIKPGQLGGGVVGQNPPKGGHGNIIEANGRHDKLDHHIELGGRDRMATDPASPQDTTEVLNYYKGLVGLKDTNDTNIGEGHLWFNLADAIANAKIPTATTDVGGNLVLMEFGIAGKIADSASVPSVINLALIDSKDSVTAIDAFLVKGKDYVVVVNPNTKTVTIELTNEGLLTLEMYMKKFGDADHDLLFEMETGVHYKNLGNNDDKVSDDDFTTSFRITTKDIDGIIDAINGNNSTDTNPANPNINPNVNNTVPLDPSDPDIIQVNPDYNNNMERGFNDRSNTDNDTLIVGNYYKGIIPEVDAVNKIAGQDMGQGWNTFNAHIALQVLHTDPNAPKELEMFQFKDENGKKFDLLDVKPQISMAYIDGAGVITPINNSSLELNVDYTVKVNADGSSSLFFTEIGLLKLNTLLNSSSSVTNSSNSDVKDIVFTIELDANLTGGKASGIDDSFSVSFRVTLDPTKTGDIDINNVHANSDPASSTASAPADDIVSNTSSTEEPEKKMEEKVESKPEDKVEQSEKSSDDIEKTDHVISDAVQKMESVIDNLSGMIDSMHKMGINTDAMESALKGFQLKLEETMKMIGDSHEVMSSIAEEAKDTLIIDGHEMQIDASHIDLNNFDVDHGILPGGCYHHADTFSFT